MDVRQRHAQLVKLGAPVVMASRTPLFDFDVESDGIPGYGSLLSYGIRTPFGDELYCELRPSSDVWIPEAREFCEWHGLQRERLMDEGVHPGDAMEATRDWALGVLSRLGKRRAALVAFNASFDFPWLNLELRKAGLAHPFGIAGYCIKSLAMSLVPTYDWSATAKSKLPPEFSPGEEFTHNAMEDTRYQQQVHFALAGALVERGMLLPAS